MEKNYIQCKGVGINFHENTAINFNGEGFVLSVSLNVPKYLVSYLPENCIKKAEKMYILMFSKQIQSKDIDVFNVQSIHDNLLKNLMYQIRIAKSKYYDVEAKKIAKTFG